ncbi:MAG: hypothetical protein Q4Q53_03100, partial [Methanocorpusculum sp.]|nr:hypothetical protein [Methanocorpusculum sp.]
NFLSDDLCCVEAVQCGNHWVSQLRRDVLASLAEQDIGLAKFTIIITRIINSNPFVIFVV